MPPDLSLGSSSAPARSVFLVTEYNHTLQKVVSMVPKGSGHRSTAPGVLCVHVTNTSPQSLFLCCNVNVS